MTETAKLTASDAAADNWFGQTVGLSGDTILIGAHANEVGGVKTGSAYVFTKPADGWVSMTETAKLTASDGAAQDHFGWAVAISGNTAVIGMPWDDDTFGSAYVFEKPAGGWVDMTETAKLTASDGASNDALGVRVAISADTIVLGADGDDDHGTMSGSAYVFQKPPDGWVDMTETAKLTAGDGAEWDRFGSAVAVSGDTALIGARDDDDYGYGSGAAYVFDLADDDCNTNGVCDSRDIAYGTSQDDNGDGVPDECQGPTEPIPTVSEWGLLALASLLAIAGGAILRHRRRSGLEA
jgi:hypothetical protein